MMDGTPPPVAIGGLGGSGTRVFAEMLRYAGVDIGTRLNRSLDNLWFTVLFKRAAWVGRRPEDEELSTAARLFCLATTRGLAQRLEPEDATLIADLAADLPPNGGWQCGARAEHAADLLASRRDRPPLSWGWKEPNTHVFLPALDRALPGLRYIHVVRDGRDMAFSANTWQTRHWAHLYGLPMTEDIPLPVRQLRYWLRANRAALDYGAQAMPGRFIVMPYEAFCADPEPHWHRLLSLLGKPASPLPSDLAIQPTTIGRAGTHDMSLFDPADIAAVQMLSETVAHCGETEAVP